MVAVAAAPGASVPRCAGGWVSHVLGLGSEGWDVCQKQAWQPASSLHRTIILRVIVTTAPDLQCT